MADTFFDDDDKPTQECGAAILILEHAGFEVGDLKPVADDPPDCTGMLDGQLCAVEVTRLTHEKARAQNMKVITERPKGRELEPEHTEVYYLWDRDALIGALKKLIDRKDRAVVRYTGGLYQRKILVIHTDELVLDRETVAKFLEGVTFPTQQLTDVVLGLSYCPAVRGYPTFRLK